MIDIEEQKRIFNFYVEHLPYKIKNDKNFKKYHCQSLAAVLDKIQLNNSWLYVKMPFYKKWIYKLRNKQ